MDMQTLLEFGLLIVGFAALVRVRGLKQRDDVSQLHMRLERALLPKLLVNADVAAFPSPVPSEPKKAAPFRILAKREALYENIPNGVADAA